MTSFVLLPESPSHQPGPRNPKLRRLPYALIKMDHTILDFYVINESPLETGTTSEDECNHADHSDTNADSNTKEQTHG